MDTSYHGGLALLSGEDGVNPEYITAYKEKRQETLRQRRGGRNANQHVTDTVGESIEDEVAEDLEEAPHD